MKNFEEYQDISMNFSRFAAEIFGKDEGWFFRDGISISIFDFSVHPRYEEFQVYHDKLYK